MTKAEWSGWIQGIGSVAAILGAFELARRQLKRAREHALELERRALIRRHNAVMGVAVHARHRVKNLTKKVAAMGDHGGKTWGTDISLGLDESSEELKWAREWASESFYMVRGLRRLAQGVLVASEIDKRLGDEDFDDVRLPKIKETAKVVDETVDKGFSEIQHALKEFEEDPNIAIPHFS